ncbi:amidohydrolase family protein [Rhizorhabdus sp.]|uniref:amidohydrolase family protein n=1 Tax=Rhizorhabdus sp. TaxID=1968843 RepID=UPI0025D3A188|nr:amidohydrolase family protein [Rhizorhabdus sp.]
MGMTTAVVEEEAIAPHLPIIDAHQHFWGSDFAFAKTIGRSLPEDLTAEIMSSGHRIAATVHADCGWAFRTSGPEELRTVGETEYVDTVAKAFAANIGYVGKLGAGIVGRASLMLGDAVVPVLEAHIAASPTRFRGIRELMGSDPDVYQAFNIPPGKARDPRFLIGFSRLARLGLSCDVLCAHPMLTDITELARAFPETSIIVNHLASPIGVGRFRDKRAEVFADWRAKITELAGCPNVYMKLSGVGAHTMGFDWIEATTKPDSETVASAIRPYILAAIEAFSPSRCMFASNFPVDSMSFSYGVLWNAFKRVTSDYSETDKRALFHDTAERVYRLSL